ncbi:serine/threonine protein kinase [Bradymonas sediminis]|uniref:Uncharacterized protein n=1 Tax=Bradymonas sediminis TaxID=1548548 RepID=A0A2Z4FMA9_9DELT|nr:hypothetical protein [Bradymonas sediminis]AWV89814.1 hypothetical protein DN745_10875 [Bradymonas sediminis]TDP76439.1 hypothetical protein DFR33_10268 [Bradymonas sediminis]
MEDLQGGTLALEHRYDILDLCDRRGLISAYHGSQDPFSRPVWVKVYDGLGAADVEISAVDPLVDRLKESARLISDLQEPGILRIIDYGELEERVPFVISERSPHPTLDDLLDAEGTFSVDKVCDLIGQIAKILAPVHRQRRAHGALSPQWIYMAQSAGDALAVDTMSIGHFQMEFTPAERLDLAMASFGSEDIAVFAPEFFPQDDAAASDDAQVEDAYRIKDDLGPGTTSPAGDVWALGVLAYTALVGVHPFLDPGQPLDEAIDRIQSAAPRPLSQLGIDAKISDVILRALSKDPRARFPHATALADALFAANGRPKTGAVAPERAALAPTPAAPPAAAEEIAPRAKPPSRPNAAAQNAELLEREPGPSDRLLSVALFFLLISNLAWLFYVVIK